MQKLENMAVERGKALRLGDGREWELQPYQQRLVWALTHGEDYRRHWDLEGPQ